MCFVHFRFKMRFSPQRSKIFRRRNFKKCSEHEVFCTLSLPNVLLATAVQFFDIRTSKSAPSMMCFVHFHFQMCFSPQRRAIFRHQNFKRCRTFRHSGVQFLISPLTTWLRTRRFNRPTFRLTRHTNHWKNTAFRDFSNILLTFALLHLLSADLTTLLCFSTVHIVGSLLFELPSIIPYIP